MTKRKYHFLFISLMILIASSCQEIYDAPLEKSRKKFLVVEGQITNNGNYTKIRLTNAIGFNDKESIYENPENAEKNAIVTITDNFGYSQTFQDMGNGYYIAYAFSGYIGRTYTLKIKTADGTEYQSIPETMQIPSNEIIINAEIAKKDVLVTNENGNNNYKTQNGVNIYVNLKSSQKTRSFFKFDTRKVIETYHAEWRNGRCALCSPTYVYCLSVSKLEEVPTVKETSLSNDVYGIKNFSLGFIQEAIFYPDQQDEIKDPSWTDGWLLSCKVSSISENEFIYYSKLHDQLTANNKIFDPLPTQLLSNVKCISDNTKLVLGYFSVSSQFTRHYYVKYNQGAKELLQREVYGLPDDIYAGCVDNTPPYFWQVSGD